MAVSETAKLIVDLSLKGNFARQMGASTKALDKFTASEGRAYKAGAQIGTGIKNAAKIAAVGVGILTTQVALGLDSLIELEKAEAQTAAVLKSTGQAAGVNGKEVTRLAEKYEALNAIVGDEFIRAGENMLLTFTNIKGRAFEPALAAILDINTAMGKGPEGMTSTAIQVGKALNDPTKGITALTRVGVTFTKKQVDKIKSLQKEGKLYEAQKIILAELNKEFGGSFAAQGDTTAGKVAKFTDAVDDLQRSLAAGLLPVVTNIADAVSDFLSDPAVIKGTEDLGKELGKMFSKENIQSGIDALRGIFNTAREVAPIVAAAAKTMGGFISSAVSAFKTLPPEIQALAVGGLAVNKLTGGLVTNIAGGLISAVLKQLVSGVVNVNGAVVNVNGAGGLPGGPGGKGKPGGIPGALGLAVPLAGIASLIGPNPGGTPSDTVAQQIFSLERTIEEASRKNADDVTIGGKETNRQLIARLTVKLNELKGTLQANAGSRPSGTPSRVQNVQTGVAPHKDSVTKQTNAIEKVRGAIQIAHHDTVNKQNAAIERLRGSIGASLGNVKAATTSAGIATAVAAKNAGITTAAATRGVTRAVDRKDLSVTVPVNVATRTSINGRIFNSELGRDVIFINGLPYGGTPKGGR